MIHSEFIKTAQESGNRVAIRDQDRQISYSDLFASACRVHARINKTIGDNRRRPVAIIGDKSIECVAAILGVLQSGRAYCFLNPTQKTPRLRMMMAALEPSMVVDLGSAEDDYDPLALASGVPLEQAVFTEREQLEPVQSFDEGSIAYVMFTSGSTGRPKGICVSHRAARLAQNGFLKHITIAADDVVGSEVALNFDVSTFDLFATFAKGACLDLIPEHLFYDSPALLEHVAKSGITSLFTVPTVLRLLSAGHPESAQQLEGLRQVLLTGELIPEGLRGFMQRLSENGTRFFNLYGATEMPWCLSAPVDPSGEQILNRLELATANAINVSFQSITGASSDREIVLSGPGLFSGAVEDVPDFSVSYPSIESFQTGDHAVPLQKGALHFKGRKDRQVRLGGSRIELAEIERWIESHPAIQLCYCVYNVESQQILANLLFTEQYDSMRQDSVGGRKSEWLVKQIQQHSSQVLPEYMQPHQWRVLDEPVLTSSGKKDYQAVKRLEPA